MRHECGYWLLAVGSYFHPAFCAAAGMRVRKKVDLKMSRILLSE
jgi:hypothetical protein